MHSFCMQHRVKYAGLCTITSGSASTAASSANRRAGPSHEVIPDPIVKGMQLPGPISAHERTRLGGCFV
jgi:hypothetical protein